MNINATKKTGIVIAVIFLVSFLIIPMSPSASLAGDKKPRVINVATFGDASTLKIGWGKGWFDETTGVKNKFSTFDAGADIIMALASGDVDFASLGSTASTIALARGVDLLVIAIEMDLGDNEALIVRKELQTISDLKGKKIAVPFGSTTHYHIMRVLKLYNIKKSELTVIDMGAMEAAGAFKGGLIDGAWTWDPGYTAMIEAGGHIMMASGTVGKMGYPTWNNIVVRKAFAEKYPNVVVNWLKAFLKTIDFYHKDPEEAAKIVAKRLGAKYETVKRIMKGFGFPTAEEQLTSTWLGDPGQPSAVAKGLKEHSNFLVDQKTLAKPLSLDKCIKIIDTSFLKKAM